MFEKSWLSEYVVREEVAYIGFDCCLLWLIHDFASIYYISKQVSESLDRRWALIPVWDGLQSEV